jgi:hypothetical protein
LLHTGTWKGLEIAIKTVIFSSRGADPQLSLVYKEALIAQSLTHENVVPTYFHDIVNVVKAAGPEPGVYKLYLFQV